MSPHGRCEKEKETAMKLTPEKVRELAIGLAVLCLVILVGIGVAVWWVDQTAP
jgi:preprotein translocase subunit Sec61beta